MKILTHPENAKWLKAELQKHGADIDPRLKGADPWPSSVWKEPIEIVMQSHLKKWTETGNYILPDRRIVPESGVRVVDRFVEYGPEDIDWLLFVGVIKKEMKRHFFVVNPLYQVNLGMFGLRVEMPRSVIITGASS